MFPTFNYTNIRVDSDGMTYLDLEIQVLFNNQRILIRNTFPATSNFQSNSNISQQNGNIDPSGKNQ
jgi:hypothetical protein